MEKGRDCRIRARMKNCLRDVGGIETLSEKALDNKLSNKL